MRQLSCKQIAALAKPGHYRVDRNLYVQVSPTGTKAWLFRYMLDGRSHGIGLGSLELVDRDEARAEALAFRRMLRDGKDPLAERRAARMRSATAIAFNTCAERYIAAHAASWRNGTHRQQWENTLKTYAYPVIGDLPVAAIDTGLVMQVLEPIWTTMSTTASRVRNRLENVIDWATARGYRTGENPARWRGHLDHLLPAPGMVAVVNHHDALPYADIPAFMAQLRGQAGVAARCLEFSILTAARSGEALGARWVEVDLKARTWTVPAERMKGGRAHVVPLSDSALALLKNLPRTGELLFQGQKKGHPPGKLAMPRVLGQLGHGDVTVHGFRSTFRDWAGETTAHPREAIEAALAHQLKDRAEAAYARGNLLAKRRDLMADWAAYCAG
jgi:integrase